MDIDIPGLTKEHAQSLVRQLNKIQFEMYNLGKVDAIETLRITLSEWEAQDFHQANIIGLLDEILKIIGKKNEKTTTD